MVTSTIDLGALLEADRRKWMTADTDSDHLVWVGRMCGHNGFERDSGANLAMRAADKARHHT